MTRKLKSETSSQKIDVSADIISGSLTLITDFVILDLNYLRYTSSNRRSGKYEQFMGFLVLNRESQSPVHQSMLSVVRHTLETVDMDAVTDINNRIRVVLQLHIFIYNV